MSLNRSPAQTPVTPVTVLEMLGETTTVSRQHGAERPMRRELQLGIDAVVRNCLRHEPPLPIELEHAIELVEEAAMPQAVAFPGDTKLVLQGIGALLISRSLDAAGMASTVLTLGEVELLFNRLVSLSEGRPASQESLPTDARYFAVMLILREFMHHLNFKNVTLESSGL